MRCFQRRAESSQGSRVWNHQHDSDLDFLTTVRALGVPISERCDRPSVLLRLVTVLNGKEASDASKLSRSIASAAPSHLVHQFTDRTSTAREQCRSLAELTAEWRTRASQQLGVDATVWARSVTGGGAADAVAG